jgi:hypothetical protein
VVSSSSNSPTSWALNARWYSRTVLRAPAVADLGLSAVGGATVGVDPGPGLVLREDWLEVALMVALVDADLPVPLCPHPPMTTTTAIGTAAWSTRFAPGLGRGDALGINRDFSKEMVVLPH